MVYNYKVMKLKRVFATLILSLISIFSLFSQVINNPGESGLVVIDSTYAEKKFIVLDCQWDYFDKKFVPAETFYKDGRLSEFNIEWFNGKKVNLPYGIESDKGFATYHCTVRNLKANTKYAMTIYKNVFTAADLYVNGKDVYLSSAVSATPVKKSPHMARAIEFYSDRNGIIDLVFHVSNHELGKGGILLIPKIAEAKTVQTYLLHNISYELLIASALLVLALYNLVIFILNSSQKLYLFLFVLCIDLIFIVLTLDFNIFAYFMPNLSTGMRYGFSLTCLSMMFPLYNVYIVKLYNIKFKGNYFVFGITCAVVAIILFVPLRIISPYNIYLLGTVYACSIYLLFLIMLNRKTPKYLYIINEVVVVVMLASGVYGFMLVSFTPAGNYGVLFFKATLLFFATVQTVLGGVKRDELSVEIQEILKKYEKKKSSFSRFLPQPVIDYLQIENTQEINAGDNSICEGMILVADVRRFNEITAKLETKKAFKLLSDYYNIVSLIVRAHGGFIIKYLGDGIIAFFPDKNEKVCRCAVEIQKEIKRYDAMLSENNIANIKIGIGIHIGKVAVGFMGDKNYLQSVSCSESIRYAIEVESNNRKYDSQILISERALSYCRNYEECLYEGILTEVANEQTLLYKVIPHENINYGYSYYGDKA